MSSFKSYREESKSNYGTSNAVNLTLDQLTVGALLRIADASEFMAKNHIKLQSDYDDMKKDRDYYKKEWERVTRENIALKKVITKLKRKL